MNQPPRVPSRQTPINPARPRQGASLIPTGAPIINHMPRGKLPDANKLFPHHFLKQLYMRVHPDLFHTENVNVKIPRVASRLESAIRTATDRLDDSYLQLPPQDANLIFDLHPVTSSKMRKTNEESLASLNEITEYLKQLRLFGETIPPLKSMPKPLSLSQPVQFYCRDTELSTGEQTSFKLITEPLIMPNSQIPAMLVSAIDAFLCRILLSSGIVIPSSLVHEWQSDWKSTVNAGRYGRMKKHMPWMLDGMDKKASFNAQMKHVRRDMALQRQSSIYLDQQQRGAIYLEFMYDKKLVMFAAHLSDEQRVQAMQAIGAAVETHFDSLGMDHWVGTRILIVDDSQDATFDWAAIRLPWNFTDKEFWFVCQSYTKAIKEAEKLMKEEKSAMDKASAAAAAKPESVTKHVSNTVNSSDAAASPEAPKSLEPEYEKFGDDGSDQPQKDRALLSEIQQRIKAMAKKKTAVKKPSL